VSDNRISIVNTEAEVQRLSTNWRTLLDAMPEMVFLLNDDCKVEYMNRSAHTCFGNPCPQPVDESLKAIGAVCRERLLRTSDSGILIGTIYRLHR